MNNYITVTKSSMPTKEEYFEEILDLWTSRVLTNNGVKHRNLESKLLDYLNVPYMTIFSNGHLALEYSLAELELKGEVITTPFSFISTANSIVRAGLTPVFCDIDEMTLNIDPKKIEALITDQTVAIMPVHVYGNPCDVYAIDKIAKKHKLKVIYDAAHAFGVKIDGKGIGSFGDITMYSFHSAKVFNTVEGGALAFGDMRLKSKFESMKNFGIISQEEAEYIGGNAKMDEFRAAMGICNLRHLDSEIEKRKYVIERYKKHLSNIKGIRLIEPQKGVIDNYAYFPVIFDGYKKTRDEIYEELKTHDIYPRKYFYPLISDFIAYKDKHNSNQTPIAKQIALSVLTLPLYSDLSLENVDRICEIIKKKENKI
ncbi:MAG: DegT/DnrJ/EryC1/StrS family aminotransferase [Bacillota bacterium]